MTEKTKKQWLKLYETAGAIRALEPWLYLYEDELLTLMSPAIYGAVYCSVMGNGGIHKAIAVYFDNKVNGFFDLANNSFPDYTFLNYQECLICHFISRQETLPGNRTLIKELGLTFRGEWTSFEVYEKGYAPGMLDAEQLRLMTEALNNFLPVIKDVVKKGLKAQFEQGETLLRIYDENTDKWNTTTAPLMLPNREHYHIELEDKDMIKEIKELPKADYELEYEFMNHLPLTIKGKKGGRDYYPRYRIIADKKSGQIISNGTFDTADNIKETDYIKESIDVLFNQLRSTGRPKAIYVRDEQTKDILSKACSGSGVRIIVSPSLECIDAMFQSFFETMK